MKKLIRAWHCTHNAENVIVPDGHTLVEMRGYGTEDKRFLLCVPEAGFYSRSANYKRNGRGMREYFLDGKFLGVYPAYREEKTRILYENDKKDTMLSYLSGTWRWNNREPQQNQIAL